MAHHVRDTLGHAGPCGRQQLHLTEDQLHLPLGPHLGLVVLGLKEHRITHPNGKSGKLWASFSACTRGSDTYVHPNNYYPLIH